MELIVTLAGVVGGTGATATAAPAAAGASALSGAQILGTAITALSTIGGGIAAASEAKAAAQYEEFKAKDERIKGDVAAANIRKQLALTMHRNKVAMAAGGFDLGSGTAVAVKKQVAHDAERELGFSQNNAARASLARMAEARRLRQRASNLLVTSLFQAVGGVADDMYRSAAIG